MMTKARDLANASTALSAVSATELAFVDGVTSAIQTQLDAKTAKATLTTTGDIYYASGANTPARLGIGSSAQVLTVASGVPSWATPAAGGGITLLSTTSLSGANVDITGISQDYTNLHILITGVTNDTANGSIRVRPDGSTNNGVTGIVTDTIYHQFSNMSLSFEQDMLRTSANNAFAINIFNYTSTTTYKPFTFSGFYEGPSSVNKYVIGGGGTKEISAIDSLFLYHGGGNFSTGTVKIYGVK
jgi:hypothetical protein